MTRCTPCGVLDGSGVLLEGSMGVLEDCTLVEGMMLVVLWTAEKATSELGEDTCSYFLLQ